MFFFPGFFHTEIPFFQFLNAKHSLDRSWFPAGFALDFPPSLSMIVFSCTDEAGLSLGSLLFRDQIDRRQRGEVRLFLTLATHPTPPPTPPVFGFSPHQGQTVLLTQKLSIVIRPVYSNHATSPTPVSGLHYQSQVGLPPPQREPSVAGFNMPRANNLSGTWERDPS